MWAYTGVTEPGTRDGVTLRGITSDAEGDAWQVFDGGRVVGRVQEYVATAQLGAGLVKHGPTWAFTPTPAGVGTRWAKSAGQTIFGFVTRDDAVEYGLRTRG